MKYNSDFEKKSHKDVTKRHRRVAVTTAAASKSGGPRKGKKKHTILKSHGGRKRA